MGNLRDSSHDFVNTLIIGWLVIVQISYLIVYLFNLPEWCMLVFLFGGILFGWIWMDKKAKGG